MLAALIMPMLAGMFSQVQSIFSHLSQMSYQRNMEQRADEQQRENRDFILQLEAQRAKAAQENRQMVAELAAMQKSGMTGAAPQANGLNGSPGATININLDGKASFDRFAPQMGRSLPTETNLVFH
jgi:hypothetical protein